MRRPGEDLGGGDDHRSRDGDRGERRDRDRGDRGGDRRGDTTAPGTATAGRATHDRGLRGSRRQTATATVARTVLPGGLRVITESLPAVRSAAFGIWAGVGSRDEDLAHAGATHYLEHLLFKGTRRRTALDISAAMDAVGGELNAFTGKEYTCYYARVLDADLPLAIDVLSDMVTSSLIEPKDVDAERGVILEEIAMNDDDPSDTVHEAFAAQLFGDTPLGRPILGTRRLDQLDHPRADQRTLRGPVHSPTTWWWRRRAASSTTRWSS